MRLIFSKLSLWFIAMFIALGLAYWASVPKTNLQGKMPTQNLAVASITKVELGFEQSTVVAERNPDDASRWWIVVNAKGGANTKGELEPNAISKFLASERFFDYINQIGKFPALRDLGDLPQDRLGDFGLLEKRGSLKIFNSKSEVIAEFNIGKQPYGARSYYVLRNSDKKVLLIGSDLIDDLAKPEARFFERNISKIGFSELRKVKFSMNGRERSFVRMSQGQDVGIQWADEAAQSQAIPALGLWLEKMGELKAAAYADDKTSVKLSSITPSVEFTVTDLKNRVEKFEIRALQSEDQIEYYILTSYLGWPAKVATARAENLVKDLPQILQN